MAAIPNIPRQAMWVVALALTSSVQAFAQTEGSSGAVDSSDPTGSAAEPSAVAGNPPPPCACAKETEPPPAVRWLEASFGSAQKFFDQSVSDPTGFVKRRTIPVNTVRVLGEWLALPRFSVMALFDLPLEPRATLVDGVITQAYVPPSLSGGIRWSAFTLGAPVDTVFEGQTIVLLGSTLAAIGRETVFPSLGWRVHLHDQQGFTLYAGASYEFRFNIIALTYGVGHRF